MSEFRPIAEARHLPLGTIADIKMASGRIYSATWEFHGNCCAWWPHIGQHRKAPVGKYTPVSFRVTGQETDTYTPLMLRGQPEQLEHSRA